jgi:uncharacterized protein
VTDLEALRALMEADRWLERVAGQRRHLPESEELARVEGELRALASALRAAQDAQSPVRAAHERARDEGARLATRASDLATKLSASGTAAQTLAALQKELDHVRELQSAAEDHELELLMELEPLDQAVEAVKAAAAPLVARRAELVVQVAELQASLDEELASLRVARGDTARAVPAALLARYDAALARSGTSGAAQLVAGRCDGCRIALAPLDIDRVKALAEGEFAPCPECGRLLLP